ncbi:MAG: diguanylate cyclase [Sulfurimonas sp.]|nr:diguanylate cyclase [Sulfurimonas sp.]PHQ91898.1 MAG: diguanylate cyclase response regulator [Sulfurimonas sp.]
MKQTILCIDDTKTNLFIIQSVIDDMEVDLYNIVLADSASKGLSILLKQKIDLILMDVMMPDIDGFEATQMIRSNKKTKNIPVIFVTAKNDDETISKCYGVGGDDYVNKPFNHIELLARISFHLNSKEKDKLLMEEKEYAQNILDLQENLILVTNGKKNFTANKALLDFYGISSLVKFKEKYNFVCETFIKDSEYFSFDNSNDKSSWIEEVIDLSKYEDVLVKIRNEQGEYIFNVKATVFKKQYIVTFTDITHVSQLALEYKYEASYDSLTQIYNRNMFHRLMDRKISIANNQNSSFVFVILDIDYFKKINDTYGHLVGDDILVKLSQLIKKGIRDRDVFARWGGEEFVLAFDVDLKEGFRIANNLRILIESYKFDVAGSITCSFGVTEFKEHDTLDDIIKRADNALYSAKDSGRNKVC